VSWETDAERVARILPRGLEPAPVEGRHLVTVAGMRWAEGRLGFLPLVPFSQLNVRLYVRAAGGEETAVFFRTVRVTPPGLGGALLGVPVRPSRLRVREGLVEAPGLGLRLAYARRGPADPGGLARHELGLFEAAGVKGFRVIRGEAAWERAELVETPQAEPLLALGFEVAEPVSAFYAESASFDAELPARALPGGPRSSATRTAR
jgi:hypothetical protein